MAQRRFYYIDPADTALAFDRPARLLTQSVPEAGEPLVTNLQGPVLERHIYEAETDADLPRCPLGSEGQVGLPNYYLYSTGSELVLDRVRETPTCTPIPGDDLLAIRKRELNDKTQEVLDQGMTVALPAPPDNRSEDFHTEQNYLDLYSALLCLNTALVNASAVVPPLFRLPVTTSLKIPDLWGSFIAVDGHDAIFIQQAVVLQRAQTLGNSEVHDTELERLHSVWAADPTQANWDALATYNIGTGWPAAPTEVKVRTRRR